MALLKKLHNRFLVWIVVAFTFLRVTVTKALPAINPIGGAKTPGGGSGIKRGFMLRFGVPSRSPQVRRRRVALETTGVFPYVKVASLASRSVPVPLHYAAP